MRDPGCAVVCDVMCFDDSDHDHAVPLQLPHPHHHHNVRVSCIGPDATAVLSSRVTSHCRTRKFFTILASVVWFGHTLNMWQWLGYVSSIPHVTAVKANA